MTSLQGEEVPCADTSCLSSRCLLPSRHRREAGSLGTLQDFGRTVRPAQVHYFKITNTSTQTVQMSSGRVSCAAPARACEARSSRAVDISGRFHGRKRFVGRRVIVFVSFSGPSRVTLSFEPTGTTTSRNRPNRSRWASPQGPEGTASIQVTMRDPYFEIKSAAAARTT